MLKECIKTLQQKETSSLNLNVKEMMETLVNIPCYFDGRPALSGAADKKQAAYSTAF